MRHSSLNISCPVSKMNTLSKEFHSFIQKQLRDGCLYIRTICPAWNVGINLRTNLKIRNALLKNVHYPDITPSSNSLSAWKDLTKVPKKKANFRVDVDLSRQTTEMIRLGYDTVCFSYALSQIVDIITSIKNLAIRKQKLENFYGMLKTRSVTLDPNLVEECNHLQSTLELRGLDGSDVENMDGGGDVKPEVTAAATDASAVAADVNASLCPRR